ncbi:hypothetical protein DBV15_02677 [Temnothorax longispinosus]|uniref:alpha-1,2-Mannosidase n=1 Tax=Temnothorax longispinosus TaxID=300112 RepID=A0A4S2K8Z2_9HYME|nr:hypothetical protein DBV15_02677 [Temnothorax longispinosus]
MVKLKIEKPIVAGTLVNEEYENTTVDFMKPDVIISFVTYFLFHLADQNKRHLVQRDEFYSVYVSHFNLYRLMMALDSTNSARFSFASSWRISVCLIELDAPRDTTFTIGDRLSFGNNKIKRERGSLCIPAKKLSKDGYTSFQAQNNYANTGPRLVCQCWYFDIGAQYAVLKLKCNQYRACTGQPTAASHYRCSTAPVVSNGSRQKFLIGSANTSAIQSETPGGWSSCGKCLDDMRLMQRLAISGLLSVILILLITGTFITRRDLASVVDRGVAPEERNEQLNPAWVQDNVVPGQDEPEIEDKDKNKDKDRRLDIRHKQFEPSVVEAPAASVAGIYVIRPPNPPLDDVTNQRREKVKEMMKHGWDNYVRYAWGKNELRPISKRGHSASIFGASNMGATIVDGLDTLYIMGLHDEFKQGRDWIAENLDFDIVICLYSGILVFNLLFFVPDILDIVAPLNEPRRHQLPIAIETFFDQEKYFLFIIINILVITLIDVTIILTFETLYAIFIQHACGLLKLTRFAECLCSTFSISYFILCIFGIASLSINLFEVSKTCVSLLKAIESKHTSQITYFGIFVFAHLCYMFWVNYFGQNLIDNSADVFAQTYNVQWYTVSPHIQKKILFILHRSSKNILFDVGHIFTFSMDGIATKYLSEMPENKLSPIVYPGTFIFLLIIFVPDFLDLIMPLDEPRQRQLPVQIECFLDQDRYFYLISLIIIIAAFVGMTVIMATENMYMIFLFEAVTMLNIFEAIATGLFVYSHVAYGFFMNYFGQDIIDHSEYFFQQIYSTQWYRAPLYAQKLLLMTLRQSTKNSKIIVGGLFVMSLEGLATVFRIHEEYFCKNIKELMERIQIDWNALQDEKEIEIIRKYAKTARRYMYAFVGIAYPGTVGYVSLPFLPDILDIVAPLNESRARNLPFLVEYFLDEQKYFYLILLHMTITLIIGIVTIVSTETLTFAYIYHICGMFEIVRFFEYFTSTFTLSYFILIVLGVASLSINLFPNYMGQKIIDNSNEIFRKAEFTHHVFIYIFSVAMYSGFFLYMLSQFIPNFLDSVAPRNESRLHNIPLTVEYFVDQQEYYLPILLHFDIIALVGFTIMISTESLLLAYIRHAIGMFEISRFIEFLRSGFVISYFFLVGLGVTSFTVNLLRLFLAAQYLNNLEECIISGLLVCGHIYYIFYGNYTSQKLIDHSTDVFHKTYVSQWYNAPLHAQKLLLFMMQHTIKGSAMTVGSIFVPSLEGFTTNLIIPPCIKNKCLVSAYQFIDLILSTFAISYTILTIIGVASTSLNLYRLLQPSTIHDMSELVNTIGLISVHFIYMFMANYVGQTITDHSDDIFNATCNVLWYIAPLSSQKALQFLIHRMIKSMRVVICNMFVASLEGFATVKYLFEQVKLDWNTVEDNNEIRILEKYAFESRLFSLFLSCKLKINTCDKLNKGICYFLSFLTFPVLVAFAIFCVIIIELIPVIFDAIAPMNESRPRKIKINFEFFIDEQQYFYIYLIYEVMTIIIGMFSILATGSLSMAFLRHCCATCKIARYNTMWYLAPLSIQKLLLFVMQNSLKTHTLIIGGIYISSLEGFSTKIDSLHLMHILKNNNISLYSCRIESAIEKNTLMIPGPRREYFIYRRILHWSMVHSTVAYAKTIIVYNAKENNKHHMWRHICCILRRFRYAIVQFLPNILDVVLPLDEPRPRKLLVAAKYFVSQDKYFLTKAFHEIVIIAICALIVFATASQMLVFCCHSFGMFKIASYIAVFLFGILQRLPLILDIISPLNESRPYQLFVIKEYFVSQDKYIQVMMLHEFLVYCIGTITVYGTGTTIMTYVTHLCALLKIASYRIENAIERNILAIPNPEKKYLLHQKIVHAVVIHQRAAESVYFCHKTFCNTFLIVILILAHLTYLFMANYCGQIVLNNGVDLFKAIYNGLWYAAPLSTQKLLLFIMQRGSVNLNISCFSIFVASLDVEYFIAQDNYFYIIALHEFFIISLYAAMISSTGTQLLLFTYHSFGMFKIARKIHLCHIIAFYRILLCWLINNCSCRYIHRIIHETCLWFIKNCQTIYVLMLLVLNSFGLFQFLPNLLDIIIPLNESRERHFTFLAEYFVDQKQYFYFILTHNLMAVYIGAISILSTGTMLMGFIMHICAMLKIASYRLEHINDNLPSVSKSEKDCIICKRIINAVDIHRRALEFGEYIISSFSKLYFILIGVGVASLTINMFQVVTDHNSDILTTTYAVQWYTISLQAQKLLLFIMQRNTKNYYFTLGSIFVASLEVLMLLVLNSFGLFQFLPNLLNIIISLNESRERHFTFLAEYFVDQEQYFYFILTHNLMAVYIGGISILSTGTMLMGFIMHICAMLKIASIILNQYKEFYIYVCIDVIPVSFIISMILYAITELLPTILDLIFPINQTRPQELHASTEYFIDKTTYFYPIFCHWIISLLFGASVLIATGLFEIIYIENICGLLRIARYNVKWYKAPIKMQKLLLFIMQSTTTPYVVNIVLLIFTVFILLIMELIPDILDFFRPLNESRAHYISFLNEYHMNKGVQFYYFLLYSIISINIGVLSVLSISSMLLVIALHCCALFKICSIIISIILYAIAELLPTILDLIFPINQTRPLELHASLEYFIDKTTYFYPIFCHWIISLLFGFSVLMATDLLEMIYIESICGLLRIARYNVKWYKAPIKMQKLLLFIMQSHIFPVILDIIVPLNSSRPRHFYILVECFVDEEKYFFLLLLHTIVTLAIGMMIILSVGTMLMSYIFHACAMFKIARYDSYWYTAPLRAQRLLLFIMQRTSKNFSFVFGGIFVVSLKVILKFNLNQNYKFTACEHIKYIFDRVRYDWNMLKAQSELEVIRRYADNAKLYTICFTSLLVLLTIICLPLILDVIVPMNESRPRQLVINVEYFVDEETYFFPILTHIVLNQYAGSMTVVAIATILIAYVLHACAMFKIARYLMDHVEEDWNMLKDKKELEIIENTGFCGCVNLSFRAVDTKHPRHHCAIEHLASTTIHISGRVLCRSAKLFQAVLYVKKIDEIVTLILFTFGHILYLFLGNYVGQILIDHSAVLVYTTIFFLIFLQHISTLLDVAIPLNESRPRELVLPVEYLIDQQKYFYVITIHMSIGVLFLATSGIATESFSLANALHAFGLFKIASLWTICFFTQYISIFLDIITPLNISRPRKLLFAAEYFIDQEKYFYIITIHIIIGLLAATICIIATEAFSLTNALHAFVLIYVCILMVICIQYVPIFLDIIMPLNKSRQTELLFQVEYFLDQEKYYHTIQFHLDVGLIVAAMTILSTESFCLTLAIHAFGMFKITSIFFRQLFQVIMSSTTMDDLIRCIIFVFCHFIYMFSTNYAGQKFIDHDADIYKKICNIQWYDAPLRTQKQILFIIQKTIKSYHIDIGGLYSPSLEGFTMLAICVYFGILSFTLVQYIPDLLDIVMPLNESRPRMLLHQTKYFANQQNYFHIIMIHEAIGLLLSGTTGVAAETFLLVNSLHAFGMFKIARCNTKWYNAPLKIQKFVLFLIRKTTKSYKVDAAGLFSPSLEGLATMRGLVERVRFDWSELNNVRELEIIKRYSAIGRFITLVTTSSSKFYSGLHNGRKRISSAAASGRGRVFCGSRKLSRLITTEEYQDTITTLLFVLGHFWYLFFCNYLGQEVIDHSSNVFHKTYNVQWYTAPVKVQKLLLLVMQRSMRHCTIMIGGLFIPSLEGFATIHYINCNMTSHQIKMNLIYDNFQFELNFSRLIEIKEYYEMIISFLIVLGHFLYMFSINYIGQKIIDHSSDVFHRAYNVQWYLAPLRVQKLLMLIMQRSMRRCIIFLSNFLLDMISNKNESRVRQFPVLIECFIDHQKFIEMLKVHYTWAYSVLLPFGVLSLSVNLYRVIFIYVSIFSCILTQFLSNFLLDIISSRNESRPRQLPILVECFIDQQKYFFPILLLFSRLIASKEYSELIISFLYILGHFWYMFFYNYLGQKVIDHSSDVFHRICKPLWNEFFVIGMIFIYVSIFSCILTQFLSNFLLDIISSRNESRPRQLPILVECFIDQQKYFFPILLLVCLVVLCGLTTVAATETLNMSYTHHACGLFEIASYIINFSCRIEQALLKNTVEGIASSTERNSMICQRIINGFNIYNVQWYLAPLKAQKLLMLVMQRSMRHCIIVIDGLFIPSFEGFATLSRLIISKEYYEMIVSFLFILGHFWYMFFCNYLGQKLKELMEQVRNDWNSLKEEEELKIIHNRANVGRSCIIALLTTTIS